MLLGSRNRRMRKMDRIRAAEEAGLLSTAGGGRLLRRMLRNPLSVFGCVVLLLILVTAIGAPLFTRYGPMQIDLSGVLRPPSLKHVFGTDKLGRDIFSRVLFGGRISILIGLGSAIGAAIIGVVMGAYGGYKGGWIDAIFLHTSEIFMAFPQIILVLLLVTIVGQSTGNLIVIFITTGWGSTYRMTRARMLSVREEEYAVALKSFGLNELLICYKHLLPNALGPIMVNITLNTAMFILQEAALSFLGLGVPLQIPSWGNILNSANDLTVLQSYWWIWLPVGIVISLFVLSVNFVGDGLHDSSDPTQQG